MKSEMMKKLEQVAFERTKPYYLTGDLEKARSVTKNVENGFFSKDFTHLVNKLN